MRTSKCGQLRRTLIEVLRDSLLSGTALAGGFLFFGITAENSVNAQQATAWSPQPFVKPSGEGNSPNQAPAPVNTLRQNQSATSGDVVRWGKVPQPAKLESQPKSYAEAIPSNNRQQQGARENGQQLVDHQPVAAHISSRPRLRVPRSGFELSESNEQTEGNRTHSAAMQNVSRVQRASHNESVETTTPPADGRDNGVWYAKGGTPTGITLGAPIEKPQRSNVQKARFQEPKSNLSDPLLPEGISPNKVPLDSPPPLNRNSILDSLPGTTQSQSTKPNRSLVEPEEIPPNPFNGTKNREDTAPDRSPSDDNEPPTIGSKKDRDPAPRPPIRREQSGVDCDAVRRLANEFDIARIQIDSSPDFVKGIPDRLRPTANTKESFVASAESRSWLNYDGQVVAEGKLVDLRKGGVIIEKEDGTRMFYLLHKLCDADQVYVSEKWGMPVTCAIDDRSFPTRGFVDTTVTWKASGACHKPLYFEDVQLERYGHEWGPFAQPVLSTAHFFGNVLVLPYKMGIHPMNECQYSLGHYRPGNCAPWTVGPIPISLRGALFQAKVVTGAALILP